MNIFDSNFKTKFDIKEVEATEPFYWQHPDSKFKFEENYNLYKEHPQFQKYKKNPIVYDTNNYGFRTPDDFHLEEEGNVFLGCSHTFGLGHYLENIWSYKLSKKIGGKFYNISENGSGVMTHYRFLKSFEHKINFKNVFHFLPKECWNRLEYPFIVKDKTEFLQVGVSQGDFHVEKYKEWFNDVFLNEDFFKFNVMVYIDAIESICKKNGADYYLITEGYEYNKKFTINDTPARDAEHYCVEEHDEICDKFYQKYLSKMNTKK